MFYILLMFYVITAFFIFFDLNLLFVNEEFLIFICMSLLFILLVSSTRKLFNFTFFLNIEYIYFFFVYLIFLNRQLLEKIYSIILLENFKLNNLIIVELYNFFKEATIEFVHTQKIINAFLIKNFVLLINLNIFSINTAYYNTEIINLSSLELVNYYLVYLNLSNSIETPVLYNIVLFLEALLPNNLLKF